MSGFRSLLRFSHAANAARIASTQRAYSVEIRRIATEDPRMSGAVVHGDMVYLSGQVPAGGPEEWGKASIGEQVETTLAKVDALLEAAGTDKSKILSAQLWVKNMSDFAAMNEKWIEWIDPANKPVRACVEAPMAHPNILFEAMIVATK